MLSWLWALFAPWGGRVLLRALPWLVSLLPALKTIVFAVAAAAVLAGIVWLSWPDERMTRAEAQQACADANMRAELEATKEALRVAQETLRRRNAAMDAAERWIDELEKEMEALRAAAPDPDAPVFAADDLWLRSGRSR